MFPSVDTVGLLKTQHKETSTVTSRVEKLKTKHNAFLQVGKRSSNQPFSTILSVNNTDTCDLITKFQEIFIAIYRALFTVKNVHLLSA